MTHVDNGYILERSYQDLLIGNYTDGDTFKRGVVKKVADDVLTGYLDVGASEADDTIPSRAYMAINRTYGQKRAEQWYREYQMSFV